MIIGQNDQFIDYVTDLWNGDFKHRYSITVHGAWRKSTEICRGSANLDWYCNSLSQAAEHYSWTGGGSEKFEELSCKLIAQVKNDDNVGAANTCKEIFEWGGVARREDDRSAKWIGRSAGQGLCAKLNSARELLTSPGTDLTRFNGSDFLMNSAMTKVYAATDPNHLIIYDGRVGAALGLLAKKYLHSIDHLGEVPSELKFGWGASRSRNNPNERNPSEGNFHFPRLFGTRPDLNHAEMMRGASNMLVKVAMKINKNDLTILPRLERALFMIGYNVRNQNR